MMKLMTPRLTVLVMATFATILVENSPASDRSPNARDSILSSATAPVLGNASAAGAGQGRATLLVEGRKAPYFASRSLAAVDRDITRAIIVIHGSGRDAAE